MLRSAGSDGAPGHRGRAGRRECPPSVMFVAHGTIEHWTVRSLRAPNTPSDPWSSTQIDRSGLARCFGERAHVDLLAGRYGLALDGFRLAIEADPHSPSPRAGEGLALDALGRHDEAQAVFDHERLVDVTDFTAMPGWPSVRVFNEALARHILARADLRSDRPRVATEGGWQTSDLLPSANEGIRTLAGAVAGAFARYLSGAAGDARSSYFRMPPPPVLRRADAVVLAAGGRQREHIHDFGYCSAVYYVRVPARRPGPGRAGCLWFGKREGPTQTSVHACVHPEEGRLVVFPSYLFHSTVPFAGPGLRLSVAFDLTPAPDTRPLVWADGRAAGGVG